MQKQMIPDPIHTLLHMVNGLSNEKVTQNFRNKKNKRNLSQKKKKIIQAGKKFQKAILHDPLTFCRLANQKKNQEKHTESSNMPTPTATITTTTKATTKTTTTLPNHSPPTNSLAPLPFPFHSIPFYYFHKARETFRGKSGKTF